MRRWLPIVLLLLLLAAGVLAWWFLRPPAVHTALVARGPAVEAIYATGTVEPRRWAALASTEVGRIVLYPAVEGASVRTGDLLVQLDDETLRAEHAELLARVAFLEQEVARYRKLLETQNVSQQTYQRVVSELAAARAAADARAQRLLDMAIVAPFDAVVLRRDREVGEVVKVGDTLLWVGQPAPYWVTADVDEEDIPRVGTGQAVLLTADAFPGQVLRGSVGEVTPMGDAIDKQYRVRIDLPAGSPLLIGMTTEVNIIVRQDDRALLVPEGAVRGSAVFLVEDGVLVRRDVTLGVFGAGVVEVRAGLAEGERVVVDLPADLAAGDSVTLAGE